MVTPPLLQKFGTNATYRQELKTQRQFAGYLFFNTALGIFKLQESKNPSPSTEELNEEDNSILMSRRGSAISESIFEIASIKI